MFFNSINNPIIADKNKNTFTIASGNVFVVHLKHIHKQNTIQKILKICCNIIKFTISFLFYKVYTLNFWF